jgi:hypothetical protein
VPKARKKVEVITPIKYASSKVLPIFILLPYCTSRSRVSRRLAFSIPGQHTDVMRKQNVGIFFFTTTQRMHLPVLTLRLDQPRCKAARAGDSVVTLSASWMGRCRKSLRSKLNFREKIIDEL